MYFWGLILFGLVITRVESTYEGSVRLAGGGTDWGRVEVFHDGVWGTVCITRNYPGSADVICDQLGLGMHKNRSWLHQIDVPKGTGKIWLAAHYCPYGKLSIHDCHHRGWGIHNCTHDNDIGVLCVSKTFNCRCDIKGNNPY